MQKTAYELRISYCSSDVCSSVLGYCGIRPAPCFGGAAIDMIAGKEGQFLGALRPDLRHPGRRDIATADREARLPDPGVVGDDRQVGEAGHLRESGRGSGRERGCQAVEK